MRVTPAGHEYIHIPTVKCYGVHEDEYMLHCRLIDLNIWFKRDYSNDELDMFLLQAWPLEDIKPTALTLWKEYVWVYIPTPMRLCLTAAEWADVDQVVGSIDLYMKRINELDPVYLSGLKFAVHKLMRQFC